MSRLIMSIPLLVAATTAANSQISPHPSVRPKDGFVPNAETAEKIAIAVLEPVYGEETIQRERPFKATRQGNVWTVTGTLNCPIPKCEGGTAFVKLSKTSGEILAMGHYK